VSTADLATQEQSPHVLAQRGGVIAIDKPAGMPVQIAQAGAALDLVTWARQQIGDPGLTRAHRVDLESSGVVLLSADRKALGALGAQFAEGQVEITYLALVFGRTHDKGIIRRPLADAPRARPVEAVTRYRTVERLGGFSLLAVRPATGRKHQIRRHLQGIGHPVVGDTRYGPPRFRPVPAFPGRLWLHAHRVRLPDGWEVLSPLPASLEAHLEVLRAGAAPEISEAEADQAHELDEIEGDAPAGEAPDTGAPAADAPEPSED